MPKLRAHNIAMSIDGYMAGADQSREDPLGIEGESLHTWMFATRGGRAMIGQDGGSEGLDNDLWLEGERNVGATIMGRNMFGPIRGDWTDEDWRGWWGDTPPYHHPVFVLTHYPHDPIEMKGGTTFHFVCDGAEAALERAFDAAGGKDVRVGGGASTIQQYLRTGLLDELHVAISPVVLGRGERLFDNLAGGPDGYDVELLGAGLAAHLRLVRRV